MVLSMSRPWKHPKSGNYYYRKAIPADIRPFYPAGKGGKQPWEEKRSLGTSDPREAKLRHAQVAAEVEAKWASLRSGVAVLTQKQIVALAGEAYSELVTRFQNEPHEASLWETLLRTKATHRAKGNLGNWVGPSVDELLLAKGLRVDAGSRERLLAAYYDALVQAIELLRRNAQGDYSPDPKANRFPAWEKTADGIAATKAPSVSLRKLFEDWRTEAESAHVKPSTVESYRSSVEKLIRHVGHEDAARLTPHDVVAFKDARLKEVNPRTGKTISAKTVKDNDLAGVRRILGWGVANHRLTTNVAAGVTVKLGKAAKVRSKGFTDDEATALLRAAREYRPGREHPKLAAAKRWVFWLCAYTGARLGEMVQLRREDVRQHGPWWVVKITPEAGTVKTNEAREVVLHPHLIEEGFPEFVLKAKPGHLFFNPHPKKGFMGPWQTAKNRLAEMARAIVPDPNVAPTHGWRHRFTTVARTIMDTELRKVIQGHAPEDVAAKYGEHMIDRIGTAIAAMPRVAL